MNGDPASEAKVKFKGSNSRRIAYQVGGENNKNQKAIQYVVAHSPPIDNLSRVGGRTMRFIDFFSGIGGFRLGMEMAGHECVGHCEIDKFANKSYMAMHSPKEGEWYANNIRRVSPGDLPKADVYCFGFPCQAFSIAGKRGGFNDTRGTLFFEVMRMAEARKPDILFAENVKGILSHNNGRTFGTIIRTMDELGYDVEWQVCNSKYFGVPQNRERVYIIGHLRGRGGRKIFPFRGSNEKTTELQGQESNTITTRTGERNSVGTYVVENKQYAQVKQIGNCMPTKTRDNPNQGRIYDINGLAPCLNHSAGGGRQPYIAAGIYTESSARFSRKPMSNISRTLKANKHDAGVILIKEATLQGYAKATEGDSINLSAPNSKTRRGRVGKGTANTLDTSCNQGILKGGKIRKLTPKECFRLQGFPDEYFERAAAVNSDSQLYKQAGNSVTVNVIYEIARRL